MSLNTLYWVLSKHNSPGLSKSNLPVYRTLPLELAKAWAEIHHALNSTISVKIVVTPEVVEPMYEYHNDAIKYLLN